MLIGIFLNLLGALAAIYLALNIGLLLWVYMETKDIGLTASLGIEKDARNHPKLTARQVFLLDAIVIVKRSLIFCGVLLISLYLIQILTRVKP